MSLNDLSLLELKIDDNAYDFQSSIITALSKAELDLYEINESIASIKTLKPECDKLDYALAASSGALCGIIDIFLVESPVNLLLVISLMNGLLTEQKILPNFLVGRMMALNHFLLQ